MDGSVDFYRHWANYKLGFGDVNAEHWLGNDKINILLNATDANHELRVDMDSVANEKAYAAHGKFSISSVKPERPLCKSLTQCWDTLV